MSILLRLLRDRLRGACWWAIGTAIGSAALVALWPSLEGNAEIEKIMDDLPTPMLAALGVEEGISISSAPGYLQARLFSTLLPIVLVVYAIGLGARAIGGSEEDGTLQLVAVAPVRRQRIALERLAASGALTIALLAVGLLSVLLAGAVVGIFDDVPAERVLVAGAALGGIALLFLATAFFVGALTGRRAPALAAAGGAAVGTYVLHVMAASAETMEPLRVISPWWWFLDRNLLVHDPTLLALGLPLLVAVALVAAGVVAFERRDLRFP